MCLASPVLNGIRRLRGCCRHAKQYLAPLRSWDLAVGVERRVGPLERHSVFADHLQEEVLVFPQPRRRELDRPSILPDGQQDQLLEVSPKNMK